MHVLIFSSTTTLLPIHNFVSVAFPSNLQQGFDKSRTFQSPLHYIEARGNAKASLLRFGLSGI